MSSTLKDEEEKPYIDLRIAQQLLDNYKATLARKKASQSSNSEPLSAAVLPTAAEHNITAPQGSTSVGVDKDSTENTSSPDRIKGSKENLEDDDEEPPVVPDRHFDAADITLSTTKADDHHVYAEIVRSSDRKSTLIANNEPVESSTSAAVSAHSDPSSPIYAELQNAWTGRSRVDADQGSVASTSSSSSSLARHLDDPSPTVPARRPPSEELRAAAVVAADSRDDQDLSDPLYSQLTIKSSSSGSSPTGSVGSASKVPLSTTSSVGAASVVTSSGVMTPIRFVVRPLGSLPMSPDDLAPTRSAPAVMDQITKLTRTHLLNGGWSPDVVCFWPTSSEVSLELRGKCLDLVDLENGTTINSQPLRSIRLWGTGFGSDSRDFAYVSREPGTGPFMCHVFRCPPGTRADQITVALREVCWKMSQLKDRSHR